MKVLVKYVRCYLGWTVSIELPPCFPTECVELSKHVHAIHVMYILKFSHAWKSELWIGSQPICGERTPTEEGQEIQCTDTVLRDDGQHIRYPEHQIQVRRNKDTEQVEPTSVYH